MKFSNLFSLTLLLSGSAFADAPAPKVDVSVSFNDGITALAKEIPGKVFVHNTERGIVSFDTLIADGFDALVCKEEDQTIEDARSAGLYVKKQQNYLVVVFNTDKRDDIVDWLNL